MGSCEGTVGSCEGTVGSCEGTVGSCEGTVGSCEGTVGSCEGTVGSCEGIVGSCEGTVRSCEGTWIHAVLSLKCTPCHTSNTRTQLICYHLLFILASLISQAVKTPFSQNSIHLTTYVYKSTKINGSTSLMCLSMLT